MKTEQWRDSQDYPGYAVSDHGRVRLLVGPSAPRILIRYVTTDARDPMVNLMRDGKRYGVRVAVLVMREFTDDPRAHGKRVVFDYADGDETNCHFGNLSIRDTSVKPGDRRRHKTMEFRTTRTQALLEDIAEYAPTLTDYRLTELSGVAGDTIRRIRADNGKRVRHGTHQKIARAHALIVKGQVVEGPIPLIPQLRNAS